MKNNKSWLSIVFSMIFVVVMSLMVIYILEFMIPFSRDTKWIENSSSSYYESVKWLEDALFFAKSNELIDSSIISSNYEYKLIANTNATNTMMPFIWKWNSSYDKDFNIIKAWMPIQLEIWNGRINNWTGVKIKFKVPNLDGNWSTTEVLSGTTLEIVNWQLSGNWKTLFATGTILNSELINFSVFRNIGWLFWRKLLSNSDTLISAFYSSNCWTWKKCSLKFSIINKLENTTWAKIPYLEWKIDFTNNNIIPTRFFRIISSWKSKWFKKTLEIQKAQQTVIQAFDFTVIQ